MERVTLRPPCYQISDSPGNAQDLSGTDTATCGDARLYNFERTGCFRLRFQVYISNLSNVSYETLLSCEPGRTHEERPDLRASSFRAFLARSKTDSSTLCRVVILICMPGILESASSMRTGQEERWEKTRRIGHQGPLHMILFFFFFY